MNYRILVVEDEPKLREVLCDYFRSKGDEPFEAKNGMEALETAENGDFDAVLLDIMMPELDGFGVCRALRRESDIPIIFLTAMSDEDDKLFGFELGADDYVTKPFTMSVLYAKTVALIKRNRDNVISGNRLTAGELSIEIGARMAFVGKKEIKLTPKEYDLLLCLMRNKNMVLSREQLLVKCWGYDYDGDIRAVDSHIKRLREKLGKRGDCIQTVIKVGYKLEVEA
jgi:DNA-binding response OmpR family regulator